MPTNYDWRLLWEHETVRFETLNIGFEGRANAKAAEKGINSLYQSCGTAWELGVTTASAPTAQFLIFAP
jgi:hypothetical protein